MGRGSAPSSLPRWCAAPLFRIDDRNLDVALLAQDAQRHVAAAAVDRDVGAGAIALEVAPDDIVHEGWQPRIAQPDLLHGRIELAAERSLTQAARRRRRP